MEPGAAGTELAPLAMGFPEGSAEGSGVAGTSEEEMAGMGGTEGWAAYAVGLEAGAGEMEAQEEPEGEMEAVWTDWPRILSPTGPGCSHCPGMRTCNWTKRR